MRSPSAVALIIAVATSARAVPDDTARTKFLDLRLVEGRSATKTFGPLGQGRVRLRMSPSTATPTVPPTFDFKVAVDMRDVRDRGVPISSGFLTLSISVQAVDRGCSGASCPAAIRLPISVACGTTGGRPPGECGTRTLFDAPVPGAVGDSVTNVEVGQIQVIDGPDVVFVQAP